MHVVFFIIKLLICLVLLERLRGNQALYKLGHKCIYLQAWKMELINAIGWVGIIDLSVTVTGDSALLWDRRSFIIRFMFLCDYFL